MSFYRELFENGNTSGYHYFDAAALDAIKTTYDLREQGGVTVPDGEKISLRTRVGGSHVCDNLVVHRNGRQGTRDTAKDTLVFSITDLRLMPDDIQATLKDYEQIPGGRRPGVTRPPRTR